MKIVFGTVIYKNAWKYLDDFCKSLNEQTTQEFTILIICDNLTEFYVQKLKQKFKQQIIIVPITEKLSIPALRITLIKEAQQRCFDLLILGDFDDMFEKNRISEIMQVYSLNPEYAFFYNQLADFYGNPIFSVLPEKTTGIESILQHNFCGLSNTALNLHLINKNFIASLLECDTPVFDWYLFSRILLCGYNGRNVKGTKTFYRIHANNIAGISAGKQVDLEKELSIKRAHYTILKSRNSEINRLYSIYNQLTIKTLMLDKIFYLNQQLHGYWWERIRINEMLRR